jgi:hypothetical protein
MGHTVLALLVALVSVLAVAVPAIISAFQDRKARLTASIVQGFDQTIDRTKEIPKNLLLVAVINSGTKPAIIGTELECRVEGVPAMVRR